MKRLVATLAIFGILAPSVFPALAFDPNYILSDDDMTNGFALDRNQIQAFLDRGYLGDYKTTDYAGVTRSATDIIWRAAQTHGISPKFLLVLLQKEQSLVEDDEPTQKQLDWATGYAVCDDCPMDDPAIQRWKGFGKQINSAALQFGEGYMADISSRRNNTRQVRPGRCGHRRRYDGHSEKRRDRRNVRIHAALARQHELHRNLGSLVWRGVPDRFTVASGRRGRRVPH